MAMALPFFISSLLIPFIGIAVDKFGRRGYLLIFSALLGIVTYVLFIFTTPIIPLILLGFTYAIFASVFWPALTLLVPKNIVGIALGFATSLQNFGLVIFPLIIAFIYTNSQSYDITLLFFIFILVAALIISIFIDFEDHKHNRILDSVQVEESPKYSMNKSAMLSRSIKSDRDGALSTTGDRPEEEARLLKIKDLI
jgi:MFS family permease